MSPSLPPYRKVSTGFNTTSLVIRTRDWSVKYPDTSTRYVDRSRLPSRTSRLPRDGRREDRRPLTFGKSGLHP